jgi:nucleoid-associated protein YgaU
MAQSLDQLKTKYQGVLGVIQQVNGHLENVNMDGDKLYIKAEVANEDLKNKIWNEIKQIDASYSDLVADIVVNSALQPPAQQAQAAGAPSTRTYTVKPGDSLSKISQEYYGKASEYNKIFEANKDKLDSPDHIRAGMTLTIPE